MGWDKYYNNLGKVEKPRLFFMDAIQHLERTEGLIAIDFGCGIGVEVEELVRRDFRVHAYDQSATSIQLTKSRIPDELHHRVNYYQDSFENILSLPDVDFFHSFHSLPFCKSIDFLRVLDKTIDSVKPNGVYAVTLFGIYDEWCIEGQCSSITTKKVKDLLIKFNILHLKEIKAVGSTAAGIDKNWHVIEVIARRHLD